MTRLALILAAVALPSQAQQPPRQCAPLAPVAQRLAGQFGETAVIGMAREGGATVVLYANAGTGSWTLVEITGDRACLLRSGQGVGAPPAAAVVERGAPA